VATHKLVEETSDGYRPEARREDASWQGHGDDEQRAIRVERRGSHSTNLWVTTPGNL
jgi:hypothetical protein